MKLKKGNYVQVISDCQSKGERGIIKSIYNSWGIEYANVQLDNKRGSQQYNIRSLKLVNENKGDNNMITGNFKVAKVSFLDGSNTDIEYEYALFNDYQIGDICVVKSAHHGLGIARIKNIINKSETQSKDFKREIINRVDMNEYEERKEKRQRVLELKNKMDQIVENLQEITLFEMMAEKSPELKETLNEYKKLVG